MKNTLLIMLIIAKLCLAQNEGQEVNNTIEIANVLLNTQDKISWSFKKLGDYVIESIKKYTLLLNHHRYILKGIIIDKDGLATHDFLMIIDQSKVGQNIEGECSYNLSLQTKAI